MSIAVERRRVLVAARTAEAPAFRSLFAQPALQRWEMLDADSVERARFLLQHDPFDILLVDESLVHTSGPAGMAWLGRQCEAPAILLTGMEPDTVVQAYELGVSLCLPRLMSLDHPHVLAAALERTAQGSDMHQRLRRSTDRLHQCRRQVDRLVNLLWRTVPMDAQRQWLTQRHAMERLQEEIARSSRHGSTFTVAVGEVDEKLDDKEQNKQLSDWTTAQVARAKRRCDVAGHYGLSGFMLLMVQTPKNGALTCCRRLQAQLEKDPSTAQGPHGTKRAFFGLSSFSPENGTMQSMLGRAEKHLQAAKAGIGGRVVSD